MYLYGLFSIDARLPRRVRGVDGHAVSLHRVGDIVALVHLESVTVSNNPEVLAQRLEAQRSALETVQASVGLPLRIHTELTPEALERLLKRQAESLLKWLTRFAGQAQVNLVVHWDSSLAARVVAAQQQIVEALAALPTQPTEGDLIHIGRTIEQALSEQRRTVAAAWRDQLSARAVPTIEVPCHEVDEVLRVALLVEGAHMKDLDQWLSEALDVALGMRVQRSKPGMPHGFATLTLHEIASSDLERAQQILGLEQVPDVEGLRHAFRVTMKRIHPDRSRNDSPCVTVEEVGWARDTLSSYRDGIAFQLVHGS